MKSSLDTRWQFLEHWLDCEEAEAPVLLIGTDGQELEQLAEKMAEREGVEVVRFLTENPTISIEELREVLAAVARTTLMSKRLVIMPAAERLSLPAANALLKSLEEHSAATRWLLTSTNPGRLLPTIRSRCQQVWVAPAASSLRGEADDEVTQITKNLSEQLHEAGPSRELTLAFTRLRDYYHIKSVRGNEKLAREVLLASLPENTT